MTEEVNNTVEQVAVETTHGVNAEVQPLNEQQLNDAQAQLNAMKAQCFDIDVNISELNNKKTQILQGMTNFVQEINARQSPEKSA